MSLIHVFAEAAQVLTLQGRVGARGGREQSDLRIIERGSVVVRDGHIIWVGPHDQLDLRALEADPAVTIELHECRRRAVMPGLVDSHTHLVWGGDRKDELEARLGGADYEQIFAAGGGILSSVRQTRARDEDQLYIEAHARALRMRRCGTTTFEVKSGYGLELDTELRQLRVARRLRDEGGLRVVNTCLAAHAVPADRRSPEGREFFIETEICAQILPAVAAAGLAEFVDVFCDRGAFTPPEARRICERAQQLGLRVRLHANELGPTGGARLAAELRAASADHLLHIDDHDRRALRGAGVVATLLPGTSLFLQKPYADGRALIEAGVPVAVATDCNPGSCAIESLTLALALACHGNRLTPAEAICAVTHNPAASLGLADQLGSLTPGHIADLLLLDTDDYRDLIYHAGSPLIAAVFQAGRRVA